MAQIDTRLARAALPGASGMLVIPIPGPGGQWVKADADKFSVHEFDGGATILYDDAELYTLTGERMPWAT